MARRWTTNGSVYNDDKSALTSKGTVLTNDFKCAIVIEIKFLAAFG